MPPPSPSTPRPTVRPKAPVSRSREEETRRGRSNLSQLKLSGLPICASEEPLDLRPVPDGGLGSDDVLKQEMQVARLLNKWRELSLAVDRLRLWEPIADKAMMSVRYDRRVRVVPLEDQMPPGQRPDGLPESVIECKPEGFTPGMGSVSGFDEQTIWLSLREGEPRYADGVASRLEAASLSLSHA